MAFTEGPGLFVFRVFNAFLDRVGFGGGPRGWRLSGGSVREADGSRAADLSHPAQDPARDLQADATRLVACAAVPAAPGSWLALPASLLLAGSAHPVRQRRLA